MVVSIMMREDWLSHVMYQKSVHVEASGPCVAIYLVLDININANKLPPEKFLRIEVVLEVATSLEAILTC